MTEDEADEAALADLDAICGAVLRLAVMALAAAVAPLLPMILLPLAQPVPAALLGLVAGERAGWVKEYVWDASGKGTVDRDDYLWTGRGAIAGAVAGALVVAWMGSTV